MAVRKKDLILAAVLFLTSIPLAAGNQLPDRQNEGTHPSARTRDFRDTRDGIHTRYDRLGITPISGSVTMGAKGGAILLNSGSGMARTDPLIIDHSCTDLGKIPDIWISQVKSNIRWHYAHTSHGEQLTAGLERLESRDPKYSVAIGSSDLPSEAGALCIFDGQESETYITPDLYWDSAAGRQSTNSVLAHNPAINVSAWAWCCQQDDNDYADTQRYLDAMSAFEAAHPEIAFVYMTGNAQSAIQNRRERNNQIRNYCLANNKVLFDFADLDCWYNGQQHTEDGIPTEHPHYSGDEAGHTTYESCENKGRAVWWMMARLAGWSGPENGGEPPVTVTQLNASHRSGQTFVTWRERSDISGERYRIYRHTAPITADNLASAQRLAEVPEGSSHYMTERWRADYGEPVLQNNFIIVDLGPELADDTGLYVHTVHQDEGGTGYYAVTCVVAGVEQPALSAGDNALVSGIQESIAEPAPVLVWQSQSGMARVYTQFMDCAAWNPTFTGYAYNYTVTLPEGYDPVTAYPLYIHLEGWGTRYSYQDIDGTPWDFDALQIWVDDPHQTWYYGFSGSHNYGEMWPQNIYSQTTVPQSGAISNYTEQRILCSIHDLIRDPLYNVDVDRIYAYGHSMGASGALALGMRYPETFAAVMCNQPMTDYGSDDPALEADWISDVAQKWGAPDQNLSISNAGSHSAHLSPYDGTGVWDWMNHQQNMIDRQGDEMAYIHTLHGTLDDVIEWDSQGRPWVELMNSAARRGWQGVVETVEHTWVGFYDTPNFNWGEFSFRRDSSFPAFSNFSLNLVQAGGLSYYNFGLEWSCSWNEFAGPIVDTPELYEIVIRLYDPGLAGLETLADRGTVDITPRRLQQFDVVPDQIYSWENLQLPGNQIVASGTVISDTYGLITVPDFQVSKSGNRLRLSNTVVPVELAHFRAAVENGIVRLAWRTCSESMNYGFEIERALGSRVWNTLGFVQGRGTTSDPSEYVFFDRDPACGACRYRLKQIDLSGRIRYSDVLEIDITAPEFYALRQNYPNPFNPCTTIQYSVPRRSWIEIDIRDSAGRRVRSLVRGDRDAGIHRVVWNGLDDAGIRVSSGLYLCTLRSRDFYETKKMLLIK